MTLIPNSVTSQWRKSIRQSDALKIKVLCEVRDFIFENKDRYPVGQLQKEAAEALMMPVNTLRDQLGVVREYDEDTLKTLLSNGISFGHIEIANQYSDSPLMLLMDVIENAAAEEKVMTCDQLLELVLSGRPSRSPLFQFNSRWTKFAKVVNYLPEGKREEGEGLFREFGERLRSLFATERN